MELKSWQFLTVPLPSHHHKHISPYLLTERQEIKTVNVSGLDSFIFHRKICTSKVQQTKGKHETVDATVIKHTLARAQFVEQTYKQEFIT